MTRQFGRLFLFRTTRRPLAGIAPPCCQGPCRCSSSTDMATLKINGESTPPTHLATCAMVTLRVGLGVALGDAGGVGTGRDAVADGDLLWPDEDVLDEQLEDPAALAGAGGGCLAAQLGQEAFQVAGELEVGIAV